MNRKSQKTSRSSSTEDRGSNQKRRKLDSADSSRHPSSGHNSGRINQIYQEMSDRWEEVNNIVVKKTVVDKEMMKELQSSLEEARASARNLQGAQVKLSKKNTEMRRRNIDLWNRNAELADNLASMTDEVAEERLKRNAAEKNLELQKVELKEAKAKIEEVKLQRASLWEEIQELLSKTARGDHLEGNLKSLRNTVAPQKNAEDLKKRVTSPEAKSAERTLEFQELESIKTRVTSGTLNEDLHHVIQEDEHLDSQQEVLGNGEGELEDTHGDGKQRGTDGLEDDGESSPEEHETLSDSDDTDHSPDEVFERATETRDEEQELKIWLGRCYGLVSDRRYFRIDWRKECEYLKNGRACCKKCSYRARRMFIKDHVWCKHYEGKFLCAYCPNSGGSYAWRNSLRRHISKHHFSVLQLKE